LVPKTSHVDPALAGPWPSDKPRAVGPVKPEPRLCPKLLDAGRAPSDGESNVASWEFRELVLGDFPAI